MRNKRKELCSAQRNKSHLTALNTPLTVPKQTLNTITTSHSAHRSPTTVHSINVYPTLLIYRIGPLFLRLNEPSMISFNPLTANVLVVANFILSSPAWSAAILTLGVSWLSTRSSRACRSLCNAVVVTVPNVFRLSLKEADCDVRELITVRAATTCSSFLGTRGGTKSVRVAFESRIVSRRNWRG